MKKYILSVCVFIALSSICGCDESPLIEVDSHRSSQDSGVSGIQCDNNGENVVFCQNDECVPMNTCPNGCKDGECIKDSCGKEGVKQCNPQAHAIEVCDADGSWSFYLDCPNGCDSGADTCLESCHEGDTRCDDDGQNAVVCRDNVWESTECINGCDGGSCVRNCPTDGLKECQGNKLAICHQNWEIEETCEFGCDAKRQRCKPECQTAGEQECTEQGELKVCQDDFTWQITSCAHGCFTNSNGESFCKPECENAGEVRCQGNGVETCSNQYRWEVTTESCEHGCQKGSCIGCSVSGQTSCNSNGNVQTCQADLSWKETQSCHNGCYNGKCKLCSTAGKKFCNSVGHVQICQSDGSLKQTDECENGCFENDTTAYCKSCFDIGGSGCSVNGKDILTCTDYHLVKTKTCDIACKHYSGNSPYCAECASAGKSCSADGKSLLTCSESLKQTSTTCANGCANGKCKECKTAGAYSCGSSNTLQYCQSDYTLKTAMNCQYGCSNAVCNECAKDSDCTSWGGVKSAKCVSGKCVVSECNSGFIALGNSAESSCVRKIPFTGNAYVTAMNGNINTQSGSIMNANTGVLGKWNNSSTTLSFYIAPKDIGTFKLYVNASLPANTTSSKIAFTLDGITREITLNSTNLKFYNVGTWNIKKAGYIKLDIKGVSSSPSGSTFANFENFYIAGVSMKNAPTCLTKSLNDSDMRWYRRGHHDTIWYSIPSTDNIEWFYTEITPGEGSDFPGAYLCSNSATNFYMGLQEVQSGMKKVWFNVWSSYVIKDESNLDEAAKIQPLRIGKLAVSDKTDASCGDLGNNCSGEGCGYTVSLCNFEWVQGKTYKTLVHVKPGGSGSSVYTDITGYITDPSGNWQLIASLRKPGVSHWYGSASSFLENFRPESGFKKRTVSYSNIWYRTNTGTWKAVTGTTQSNSWLFKDMGLLGYRNDLSNSVSGNAVVLSINGYFDGVTGENLPALSIKNNNSAPNIDFNALEKLN